MFQVTINGKIENYEAGTPYLTIAKKHQAEYPQDIILVFVNGKLTELYNSLKKDCELKFVTTADAPGMQTYQRSATLMMLKAFYEVVGTEHIERVFVDFSVGKGLFADARGDFTLNQELLDRVKAKMHEYADQKIPIMKSALKKDEAIELFHRYRMHGIHQIAGFQRSMCTGSVVLQIIIMAIWRQTPATSVGSTWFLMNMALCCYFQRKSSHSRYRS